MKRTAKIASIIAAMGIMTLTGAAFADAVAMSPAEIVSSLTGKTLTELQTERSSGKTYGSIAKDSGKLEEFQTQMLEQKKLILEQRVKDGRITQADADKIYSAIKNNQASCDGNGSERIGQKYGAGFGAGAKGGSGMGAGNGQGAGNGMHRGIR